MQHKNIKRLSLSLVALPLLLLSGCGDSGDSVDSAKAESGLKNSSFYLSPQSVTADLTDIDSGKREVDQNGVLSFELEDNLPVDIKALQTDIHYSSIAGKGSLGKGWRTSFDASLDTSVDYDSLLVKSDQYSSAQAACEKGFSDIKDTLYRGLLSDAVAVYNASNSSCSINRDNGTVASFEIWDKDGVIGDSHAVTKPNGDILIFSKDSSGKYLALDQGIEVQLFEAEGDILEYVSADNKKYSFDKEGKLIRLMVDGKVANLEYKDDKIVKVSNQVGVDIVFSYDNDKLSEIAYLDNKLTFNYQGANLLSISRLVSNQKVLDLVDMDKISQEDLNSTDLERNNTETYTSVQSELGQFSYNENGLIVKISKDGFSKIIGEEELSNSTKGITFTKEFSYDDLGRVIAQDATSTGPSLSEEKHTDYIYENDMFEILSGDESLKEFYDVVNSIQVVKSSEDSMSEKIMSHDENGRVIKVTLAPYASPASFEINYKYNDRGQRITLDGFDSETGIKTISVREFDPIFNKVTKFQSGNQTVVSKYSANGQIVKKEIYKGLGLASSASYSYDRNGFPESRIDNLSKKTKSFTVSKTGKSKQSTAHIHPPRPGTHNNVGWSQATGFISAKNSATTVTFVEGAKTTSYGPVGNFLNLYYNRTLSRINYFHWEMLDGSSSGFFKATPYQNPFNKQQNTKQLIVVGHSFGGDSSVEALSKTIDSTNPDLLITVDPVGQDSRSSYVKSKTKRWIDIYAMSGSSTGKKRVWRTWTYSTEVDYMGVCGSWYLPYPCWKTKTISVTQKYPGFDPVMSWNASDWTAYLGGKGSHSDYDPGDVQPDLFIKIKAHHGDFSYMVGLLESGSFGKNNNFSITPQNKGFQDWVMRKKSSYNKYPMFFSTTW